MKMRLWSLLSLAAGYAFLTSASGLVGGCGGSSSGGSTGTGGTMMLDPNNLISDFEDPAAATVVNAGTPPRNGYWYTYNNDNPAGTDPTCMQIPKSGPQLLPAPPATYVGTAPPSSHPDATGSFALHAVWSGCTVWGAGVGADLFQPAAADGGTYTGPKVAGNVGAYTGITFWAMAAVDTDTHVRLKVPMTAETKVEDGGTCVESPTNKCSDDWGAQFNMPTDGSWKQFSIKFSDAIFKQEGWGKVFPWNPADVTSIQFQSTATMEPYDFWIDDVYFF